MMVILGSNKIFTLMLPLRFCYAKLHIIMLSKNVRNIEAF